MMYRTVDTSTIKGIKQAERLLASGWSIYYTGLYIVRFKRNRNQMNFAP